MVHQWISRALTLSLLVLPRDAKADSVSIAKTCFAAFETITVDFEKDLDSSAGPVWIGIYKANAVSASNADDLPEAELWVHLCGNKACDPNKIPSKGSVRFRANPSQEWLQSWPLASGNYRPVLCQGDDDEPWSALAIGPKFKVGKCSIANPTLAPVQAPTEFASQIPTGVLSETSTGPPTKSNEMRELITTVRNQIQNVTMTSPLLMGKFLRLAFHDCVGGCDGCVDMTFFDNIGLQTPIDVLKPIVEQYAGQGLSRTDIWMLAAVVAADVAETTVNIDFPFNRIGRKTCEEIHNGDCGLNSLGEPAVCDASGGPHRPLCHADIDGSSTLEKFMFDEFGFDAQQTTAIMGAHSVGAMRDVNLGFDGRTGWDLSFDDLDNGYFIELVGDDERDPSNWTQVFRDNSHIPGKPPRFQFEAKPKNVSLTMLNSDIALVRNLVEGENLMPDGEVTCTFFGPDACSSDTPFMPYVKWYAKSRGIFVVDFRDALELMIDNGYELETWCAEDEVCTLTSLH